MTESSRDPFYRSHGPGVNFRHLESTDSTNRQARMWMGQGAPHGAVVLADHQSAGRGRFERRWTSERGKNLLFTIILRKSGAAGLIPLASALSVAGGIRNVSGIECNIKWPNDVRIADRKVAGILAEKISGDGGHGGTVVGIGINVNQTEFPDQLEQTATSVSLAAGRLIERASLYHAILDRFEKDVNELEINPDHLLNRYMECLSGVGSIVRLRATEESGIVEGIMLGVAPDGGLEVETEHGRQVYYSGDVTLGAEYVDAQRR